MTPALATTNADLEMLKKARIPRHFGYLCHLTREDSTTGPMSPSGMQKKFYAAKEQYKWLYVVKPRQAWMSTAAGFDLLRHCLLHKGQRGIIIAEKEATALEVYERLVVAQRHLPPPFHRGPSAVTRVTSQEMETDGGSRISVVTGGSDNPAIGHSPDYLHITEYGEIQNYVSFNRSVFPAIVKRPNAHLVIETTPGPFGSDAYYTWIKALDGEGYFAPPRGAPLFLEWWTEPTYCDQAPFGFTRTQEEHALANRLHGITDAHFMFRRNQLDTFYHGDVRVFDSKYPPGPREGWITDGPLAIPPDAVRFLLERTNPDGSPVVQKVYEGEERYFEPREPGAPYLLTCDPAGHGETGDPSAWTLWHGWDRREVGCWSGRIDPVALADKIIQVQKAWGCDVLVEANKDACCAALRAKGCPKLVWVKGQPGWYATDSSKASAVNDLVDDLRHNDIDIRTQQTLSQIGGWDGKTRKLVTSPGGGGHHFDRAVTCVIAAFGFRYLAYRSRPRPRPEAYAPEPAGLPRGARPLMPTVKEWLAKEEEEARRNRQGDVAGRRGT